MEQVTTSQRRAPDGPGAIATTVLILVAASWLGLTLLGLSTQLRSQVQTDPSAVATLILGLSAPVIGAVFAGAVAGLAAASWAATSRVQVLTELPRSVCGAAAGVVVGGITGVGGFLSFSDKPAIAAIVGGTVAVMPVLGGFLGALRPPVVVTAGLIGTACLLGFFLARGLFQEDVLDAFGNRVNTYQWFGTVGGMIAGMGVGLIAYLYLRSRRAEVSLYAYILAGATPGGLWLLSEIGVRVSGWLLLRQVGDINVLDRVNLTLSGDAQINGGMAAFFAGATTAVLAFGLLTVRPEPEPVAADADEPEPDGTDSVPSRAGATGSKSAVGED